MLNILCGFSAHELASAFVSSRASIEKRIQRSKKVLAGSKRMFDITVGPDFSARLPAVQRALYPLFNGGYHGASPESAVRAEPCREAMRLAAILLDHPPGATPGTYALTAMMCLGGARLPARVDMSGNLNSLFEQDRSQWDQQLVGEGLRFLELSASGSEVSEYHIEAAIASIHARARSVEDTDWRAVVPLYDTLLTIRPSPVVALNRAIAIAQLEGPELGLQAMASIEDRDRLSTYPFYFAALGELEFRLGRNAVAREHFGAAKALARNQMERLFLEQRVKACGVEQPRAPRI